MMPPVGLNKFAQLLVQLFSARIGVHRRESSSSCGKNYPPAASLNAGKRQQNQSHTTGTPTATRRGVMATQVASLAKTAEHPQQFSSEGRRRCMRVALHRGGTARYGAPEQREHVAFVRDFNFNGIYFFSDFEPEAGSQLEIAFSVPDSISYKRFRGKGIVVR